MSLLGGNLAGSSAGKTSVKSLRISVMWGLFSFIRRVPVCWDGQQVGEGQGIAPVGSKGTSIYQRGVQRFSIKPLYLNNYSPMFCVFRKRSPPKRLPELLSSHVILYMMSL